MPSATMSSFESTPHIPAWKRLGLKLKSAQETLEVEESRTDFQEPSPKRQRISREEDDSRSRALEEKKASAGTTSTSASTKVHTDPRPSLHRKKSVTFAEETKSEDGQSVKQLFNTWVQDERSKDPSFIIKESNPVFTSPEPPKVEEDVDRNLPEAERRIRRVKKPKPPKSTKSKLSANEKATASTERPFLAYLKQYCKSRQTWKFNKAHQNHIIKHAFNLKVIPSEYAHYLYEYLRNLQGGCRTRLRDTALKIKVEDQEAGAAGFPETMENKDKRQREYDLALNEFVADMTKANTSPNMGWEEGVLLNLADRAMKERVSKRMRAEQMINAMGTSREGLDPDAQNPYLGYGMDEESQKRLRMNDGSSQKVGRKKKQRTAAIDTSSSESERSESERSEDSSEDDSDHETAQADGEDTSSSSSSSSSSGSEEEESEESSEGDSEGDSQSSEGENQE